ncbi:MAG: thioredoxin domain-containing protein [Alphaproteobacteria bacterium]|nr:thioredoxin domain-containing protein [Alphaproteobacteria bacterium]
MPVFGQPALKPIDQYGTTADNGITHGSADAPLKLVEYFSPTCPHCKHFHDDANASLKAMIAQGKLRYEVRPLLLPHPHDAMLDVLIRCGTPKQGFALADIFFRRQDAMFAILQRAAKSKALVSSWEKMSTTALSLDFATRLRVYTDTQRVGISTAQAHKCLMNDQNYLALGEIAAAADQQRINGTPTFYINNALVDIPETGTFWTAVKAALETTPASAQAAPSLATAPAPSLPQPRQKGS